MMTEFDLDVLDRVVTLLDLADPKDFEAQGLDKAETVKFLTDLHKKFSKGSKDRD